MIAEPDSYATCPKCFRKNQAQLDALRQAAIETYGKVPARDYLDLLHRQSELAKNSKNLNLAQETFLEMNQAGLFTVRYRAECLRCDFKFDFRHEFDAMTLTRNNRP